MTPKQKENLKILEQLGFSTRNLTYDELVGVLLDKYIMLADACEWDDRQRLKKGLENAKKSPRPFY